MSQKLIRAFKEYQVKARKEFGLKMMQRSMMRKSKFLKKPLYLNSSKTKIKVRWLKNQSDIEDYLSNCLDIDYNQCFFLNLKKDFNTLNFLIDLDIVFVDLNWQVKKIYKSVKPNTKEIIFPSVGHMFVFCKNSIDVLKIGIGDTLQPMIRN